VRDNDGRVVPVPIREPACFPWHEVTTKRYQTPLARDRGFGGGPCVSGAGNALSLSPPYPSRCCCRRSLSLSPPAPSRYRCRISLSLSPRRLPLISLEFSLSLSVIPVAPISVPLSLSEIAVAPSRAALASPGRSWYKQHRVPVLLGMQGRPGPEMVGSECRMG
jgi:hypothetical protein